jgi:acetoin utilization deacetylase AcuC-like enzyme
VKAVFHHAQSGHVPTRFLSRGNVVPYPEVPARARRLMEGVRKAGIGIHAARNFPRELILRVHTRRYLQFLESAHGEWASDEEAFPELVASLRPLERPATYPRHILGRAGWHMMDFSCPLLADTFKAVRASADTALTAAMLVMEGDRSAYALCRPPGHHAYPDRAGGFCYLNNVAIAAEALRERHDRVAILDLDVHHGNGTQAIFYSRADVLTVSIHADPRDFYPFYYGHEHQTGQGDGQGFNINIPVPVGSDDAVWLGALEHALAAIEGYGPQVLLVALGLDAHEADPLQGGAMTTAGFREMAVNIATMNLPTVIVQEGGYLTDFLADNLAAFLRGLAG